MSHLTYEQIAEAVSDIRWGLPLATFRPIVVAFPVNATKARLYCGFQAVPHRDHGNPIPIRQYSVGVPLSVFKTTRDVYRWVQHEIVRMLKHEVEESLFVHGVRVRDPHGPDATENAEAESESFFKRPV